MKTVEIKVANMECNACARAIKNTLSAINGITDVDVNLEKAMVSVTGDNPERKIITEALDSIGYPEVTENKNN